MDGPQLNRRQLSPREEQITLFGRHTELQDLKSPSAGVLILTGDSGVGKSELLREAQARLQNCLAPSPITLDRAGGSLQNALLRALAEATAELASEQDVARKVSERLVRAGKALAKDRGHRLAQVVATEILNAVKARVGEHAGQALGDYAKELYAAGDEDLQARIRAQIDPAVTDLIIAFAGELIDLAGGDTRVVLALDGGERLGDEDRRMLADVADRLPDGLEIRIAFGTYRSSDLEHVEALVATSERFQTREVRGIDTEAVGAWLAAEGLDPSQAAGVHRLTDGYALDVGDTVRHLRSGGSVEDAPRRAQFIKRTQQAWSELDPEARDVARRLAVLNDPLDDEGLRTLTGLDPVRWRDVLERLWRARILSTYRNGVPWFHERRREAILNALPPEDRERLSAQAARGVLAVSRSTGDARLTVEVASLLGESGVAVGEQSTARAAVTLSAAELAVAAATLEMFEPDSMNAVDADDVLRHARSVFRGPGDLVEAMGRLAQQGLIELSRSEERTLIAPLFDDLVAATVQGRTLLELGRLPLPGLASSVFNAALQPRLAPFHHAIHGLGRGSFAYLAGLASALAGGRSRAKRSHFLLLRARYHGRPLAAAVQFASNEQREEALGRLDGLATDVFGGSLTVDGLVLYPGKRLPAERFLHALGRLGISVSTPLNAPGASLPAPIDPEERAEAMVQTVGIVRRESSAHERLLYELEDPVCLHWHFSNKVWIEGEVFGGEPGHVRHETVPAFGGQDPFLFFRYSDAFGVTEDQRLGHLYMRFGKVLAQDPVVEMLGRIRARAIAWNRSQDRLTLPQEASSLEALLRDARTRQFADARALYSVAALVRPDLETPAARSLYVLLPPPGDLDVPTPLALNTAYAEMASPSGIEEVRVSVDPNPSVGESFPERMTRVFGVAVNEDGPWGAGVGAIVLGKFLGYRHDDIEMF